MTHVSYNHPQPMPKGKGPEVSPYARSQIHQMENIGEITSATGSAVRRDLQERIDFGTRKYGEPLSAFNGRDAMIDEYQEVLDCIHYAQQQQVECPSEPTVTFRLQTYFRLACNLRALLDARHLRR